ncbi:type III pantothenate kinase [Spirochaeta lutea]|uniref:Type III pantothenate kinase n=1 Tax=Spirochaeta lutea TaxID=1480694 RepID=A0A098QU93_9SPIO|nr:type III pantothenate kinase [Spirochaeta lutea]KGE71400.1 hypothetical protein DC28_11410 [Spirochaeta lutea]
MNILCIDIGNSNIALGVYRNNAWNAHWRLSSDSSKTGDEYLAMLWVLMEHQGIDPRGITGSVISSVVPELTEPFRAAIEELTGTQSYLVQPVSNEAMEIAIDNPREIGPDLFANAVAGWEKYNHSCVVVDFGTALTFTAVEARRDTGGFLRPVLRGVSIAPGLRSGVAALGSSTAQLPHVQLRTPPKAIGTNTVQSIQSGIMYGWAGLVEAVVERMCRELPDPGSVTVIATGGLSRIIAPMVTCFSETDPWLTLDGLRILYERR